MATATSQVEAASTKRRVLFVSADRSGPADMAAAWLRKLGAELFDVSANRGLALHGQRPADGWWWVGDHWDFVIVLRDRLQADECPLCDKRTAGVTQRREERGCSRVRGALHRCTLCLEWSSVDDVSTVGRWCGPCLAQRPQLVPPTPSLGWPVAGWLIGAVAGSWLANVQGAASAAVGAAALEGSVVGAGAGVLLWVIFRRHRRSMTGAQSRAGCSTLVSREEHE
jgi:hypothetical protein